MTQRHRDLAVFYLQACRVAVTSPLLADVIDADPDELTLLLAHPLALNLIRTWRVGATRMWSVSSGLLPVYESHLPPFIQRTVPADNGQGALVNPRQRRVKEGATDATQS